MLYSLSKNALANSPNFCSESCLPIALLLLSDIARVMMALTGIAGNLLLTRPMCDPGTNHLWITFDLCCDSHY